MARPAGACGSGDRLSHAALHGRVASAWQSQIARDVLADTSAAPRDERLEQLQRELAAAPPPPAWTERAADYAMLAVAAVVALGSMLLVVSRASLTTDVLLAALSALLLAGGHARLRVRRRRRLEAHEARRVRHQAEVSRVLAEGEARRQRLDTFSRLAAEIAHEVRNPLGSIVLNTELLEEELHACIHASPEVKRLARAIGAEAERLTGLTHEYAAVARLPQLSATPRALGAILDDVACFTRGEATRAQVHVTVSADAEACAVIDAKLVRQLLINLMRNALDATPPGGRVELRARSAPGRAWLDVIDTGPGVPPSVRESIFDAFFSTKPHGTGLGLAVARRIARDHGGDLVLMPWPEGAWFRLDLPAGSCPPSPGEALEPPPATPVMLASVSPAVPA